MTSNPPTEKNRQLVLEAVSRFGAGDIAGFTELLGENFVSHNPRVAHDPTAQSGRQAFAEYLSGPGSAHLRDATVTAEHLLADGDLVAVHTHVATPQGDLATVDLFRIDSDLIIEHWDVVQPVPAEILHPHGMF
ncbi:nuclear transport factor 2 family protein [Kribbella jejuensis]|uniref:Putative SnoaL-like aldol condensation-catalyzing enzyme n=1 Tax=Kribbella jejuensis TaxID=236068 RepID=A0A542ELX0_9ACTN|nr:nuclear transport factor 2 family protein [Kribbella jejuensis]TQJ16254.1 putative SnoaL-like aldol condensation-catalyzing enzyme [Kribbella jejuensis]